jgi:hypothetical protein
MASPTITPNSVAAPAGGEPAKPAAAAPAQPVHSSDRALANFNSGDPAKGGVAPPAAADPAKPAGAAPASDPAAASAVDLATIDLASVLGDDLTTAPDPAKPTIDPAAAAPAIDPNADPLEAIKDTPRVKELVAHEAAVKDAMSASPEWIKEPGHLKAAVQDAAVLWDITTGKAKVDSILIAAKQNSPEQYPQILADMKAYLEKEGIAVAAPAAVDPANMTPEQKRIAALEKEAADRRTADARAADERKVTEFNTRVANTKKTILDTKLPELLKDSVFEGEGEHFLGLVGKQLMPKTKELIEAVEKGDFKMLETAVKIARSAEAKRFSERMTRAIALQKKKLATIPRQPAAGSPPAGTDPAQPSATNTTDARRKNMAAALKTGS